jgi:hypothetical protein
MVTLLYAFFLSEALIYIEFKTNMKIVDVKVVKLLNENIRSYATCLASSNSTLNGILFCFFNSGFRKLVSTIRKKLI